MIPQHATIDDYKKLSAWHYVSSRPYYIKTIYAMFDDLEPVAIIVISYPTPRSRGRNAYFPRRYKKTDSKTMVKLNREVERISRIIVHPRYRRQKLATKLLKYHLATTKAKYLECISTRFIRKLFTKCGFTQIDYKSCFDQQKAYFIKKI